MENKSIAINVYNQCNSNCVMCTNLVKYHRKIEKPSLQKLYDRIDKMSDKEVKAFTKKYKIKL